MAELTEIFISGDPSANLSEEGGSGFDDFISRNSSEVNLRLLANTILSMCYIDKESHVPYKIISFNFGIDFVYLRGGPLHHRGQEYHTHNEMVRVLTDTLRTHLNSDFSNLEFIRTDSVTRTVFVVTDELIDRIKSQQTQLRIGDLVMSYYKIWYMTKCLASPENLTNELLNKLFSKVEQGFDAANLIPIFVMPEKMEVLKRVVDDAISVSPIAEYVLASRGYNIYGKAEPVKMWWVPVVIAQRYLQEDDIMKVRSERVLRTLLVEANLLIDPDIEKLGENRMLYDDSLWKDSISSKTDEFIKNRSLMFSKDFPEELLTDEDSKVDREATNKALTVNDKIQNLISSQPKAAISSDIEDEDTFDLPDLDDLADVFTKK